MTKPAINLADFDGVAFDIDGTLANTLPLHHAARMEAFKLHGLQHITEEQHSKGPTYGSSTDEVIGGILHAAGVIEKSDDYRQHPLVAKIKASKYEHFEKRALEGFDEIPGACDFVKDIAKLFPGKIAFVTSSPERFVMTFLKNNGLTELVTPELIITGDTVHQVGIRHKPEPDSYELAKQRMGAKKLLIFEDTVTGTAAGKQADGVVVALKTNPEITKLLESPEALDYPPDFTVNSYEEARQLIGLN